MVLLALALTTMLPWALAPASVPEPAAPVHQPSEPLFRPTAMMDFAALEEVILRQSPALDPADLEVELAAADLRQSRLLPNPSVELGWGTIPVGRLNPPGLARPLANVPNYSAGLAYTFPIAKRRPEIRRSAALQTAARANRDATVRALTLELAAVLGELAVATLRREGMTSLVENARRALELAGQRLDGSFEARLDFDRHSIDLDRSEQLLRSPASDISAALAACAGLVAMRCEGFANRADARAFLDRWIDRGRPEGTPADRPDLKALAANEAAAVAEERLGRAQGVPSPTLRFGYFHDRFVVSGNQMNSLNVSVSFPLPVFDHGQALVAGARARRAHFAAERRRRLVASEMRIEALVRLVANQRARQEALTRQILPRARVVLQDVESAAARRVASLNDVFQSRRTMSELLLEEADSYADAFNAYLELLAEFPREPDPQ